MNFLRLIDKTVIKFLLIFIFLPLQSCSNTVIGEKLENSFDIKKNLTSSLDTSKEDNKLNEIQKNKLSPNSERKLIDQVKVKIVEEQTILKNDKLVQKSNKSLKKVIFNPQPYRIILRLSGADPSAPAETVTKALRKAGVQFEVEKIERFDEKSMLKNTSLKR